MKALLPSCLMLCLSLPLAILYPYGNPSLQGIAMILALVNFFTVGIPLYYFRGNSETMPKVLLAFVLAIPPLFVCTTRGQFDELVPMQVDGRVIRLYRSNNHNVPGVEISDSSQGVIRLEPIPESAWSRLRVGDEIFKTSFSTHFTRGTDRFPAVDQSIFHAVRGADF